MFLAFQEGSFICVPIVFLIVSVWVLNPIPLLCSSILPFVLACQIKIFPPSSRPLSEEAVSQCHSAALAGESRIDDHDVRGCNTISKGRGEAFGGN